MWIGQEVGTPVPFDLVNYGVVGLFLALVIVGWLVPRYVLDRLAEDKDRLIAERDKAIAEQGARIETLAVEVRELKAEVRELRRVAGRDP